MEQILFTFENILTGDRAYQLVDTSFKDLNPKMKGEMMMYTIDKVAYELGITTQFIKLVKTEKQQL